MASKRIVRWSVVAALLVVAVIVIDAVFYFTVPDGVRQRALFVQAELTHIAVSLEIYEKRHESYPTTQEGLRALVTEGLLNEMPRDQWNHDYVYRFPTSRRGNSFDIFAWPRWCRKRR